MTMRDIDKIRQMLNRYYDGVSTPSETAQLKDFFRKTKEIPADMAADAAIFRAMDAADTEKVAVPANLKERIVAATIGSRPRILNWRIAVTAAASVAVLITLAVGLVHFKPSDSPDTTDLLAMSDTTRQKEAADMVSVSVAVTPMETEAAEPLLAEASEQVAPPPAPVKTATVAEVRYTHEVTDPAEAAKIAQKVLAMLGNSLDEAQTGIKSADEAVSLIKDPLKDKFK